MADYVDVFLTHKIKDWLKATAVQYGVRQEGLACLLLTLALSDDRLLDQAVTIQKRFNLGGVTDMENKGW